ncbi:alpha-beta hydrolase superfamily lysophospholipase [Rhizobium azibense]|uniref:Alpha-beta hydrolase superfamily lysophospholipase n=1 Tax=Rhizobium azibense TaxID=1136135 RepID=A0A4R3RJW9_9HYPH|nr:alpha/beta fold hydrolase [Rhizobium azibense]TCU23788.1 alpha-beta hydrolase superfamily lysophospholipase [Rhizobium azibense]TCU36058.1 alpha-beta hydrolase superfamily lysophospholipase [Rhizobium azibense]
MRSQSMIPRLTAPILVGATLLGGSTQAAITRQNFTVTSGQGVELMVREVGDNDFQPGKPPVVLLHGARVPGIATFDLPVEGGSLAVDLARAGHRVFIMDARGYGGSSRDGQGGSQDGQPLVRSDAVVRDIGAVVDAVQARMGVSQVALLGWATGGHWTGMYASQNPSEVSHLVLYNSLYGAHSGHKSLGPGSDTADPGNPDQFNTRRFGAYRLNTAASLLPSWDRSIPVEDKAAWRDPKVVQAYQAAAVASDPTSGTRNPPSFRAPSGAIADSFELASGHKLWDAGPITAHVLVIRSGNDFWSRPEDVTSLAQDLRQAASVRTVTIPEATHYVHLDRPDRGRSSFLSEVIRTLEQPVETKAAH